MCRRARRLSVIVARAILEAAVLGTTVQTVEAIVVLARAFVAVVASVCVEGVVLLIFVVAELGG